MATPRANDDDPAEEAHDVDPRRERSRARLLDAATTLLTTGGVEAVTVDAVVRASKVARTTLYRHFSSSSQLLAATFERLIPPVTAPPSTGTVRDRLVELLTRQATLVRDAQIQLTTLAWLALGPSPDRSDHAGAADSPALRSLRARIIEHYRVPFDDILDDPETRAQLGEFDRALVVSQLVGPIVFAKLVGLPPLSRPECEQIVDDFLAARRH